MDLTAFHELITSLVGNDDSRLSPDDVARATGLVMNRYSVDAPRRVTEDLVVLEGLVLTAPLAWVAGRSQIRSIEFPIGENPPIFLEKDDFYVYDALDDAQEIRFLTGPAVTDSVRLVYTGLHDSPDTIAPADAQLCAAFAAAGLCDQLAAKYGHSTEATLQADTVNHQDKGRFFASRARDLRAQYENKFGQPTTLGAASAVVTIGSSRDSGSRRMYH